MSTIHTPLTYNEINGKPFGLDYELAKQFADYLGVKLKVTVRQNISRCLTTLIMVTPTCWRQDLSITVSG